MSGSDMSGSDPKISFFMPGLYGGGAEDVVLKLAEEFSRRNVAVDLVVVKNEGSLKERVSERVNLVDLNAGRIATSFFPLIRYLRSVSPRVLLSTLTPTNIIAVLASITAGGKVATILIEQNTRSAQSRRADLAERVSNMAARFTHRRADEIIAASSHIADDLCSVIQMDRGRVKVIHNPVFSEALHQQTYEVIKHPWFQADVEVLLGVGRLTSLKDFPTLLRAFSRLREKREARLVILGEGEERERLQDLSHELGVADHVDLPGFVNNPVKYMANADVFVLSSASEGFGIVVVEALASGVPVVSTCQDEGPGEILEDGQYGRLVPVGDDKALSEAILKTLDNPDRPATKEKRIQRAGDFSVEAAIEKYWAIVKQYV